MINDDDLDLLLPEESAGSSWRWGTVTQVSPLRVKLDGDSAALAVTPDSLVPISATNGRVWCQLVARKVIIHGCAIPVNARYAVGDLYFTVSKTTAAAVAAAVGGGTWVAWGAGRVPVGVDTGQDEFNAVEETGGFKTHTLSKAELPASRLNVMVNPTPSAVYLDNAATGTGRFGINSTVTGPAILTEPMGSGAAHNNLQPYITCYIWKRTA